MSVLTKSYSNIREHKIMTTTNTRLSFIKTITEPNPTHCPECDTEITVPVDEYDEIVCPNCGLVCTGVIEYVGLRRIDFPFKKIIVKDYCPSEKNI